MEELGGMLAPQAAIQAPVASASEPVGSWWGTLLGVGVMLVGATTVFAKLQDALDNTWRAPERPVGGGLLALVRARVLSFGLILGFAFLLTVSLAMGAVITALLIDQPVSGRQWGHIRLWCRGLARTGLALGLLLSAGFLLGAELTWDYANALGSRRATSR